MISSVAIRLGRPKAAVLNALVANSDMIGRDGNRSPALPHAKVVAALKARGADAG